MLCTIGGNCQNLLLSKKTITDFSPYPFYHQIINSEDSSYIKKYSYLDSILVSNINYKSDTLNVKGFLIEPKKEGKHPVIIFNRGGNRDFSALTIGRVALNLGRLASKGYVVLASQYRGNAGGEGAEEFGGADVNDILALIKLVDEIASADNKRIGMYGWSRGGMMTYLALTKSDRIKAAVVGGAVSDLEKIIKDRPEMETEVIAQIVPNYYVNKKSVLESRSAVKWANSFPKNVPLLMLHGNADWRVKPEHSLNLALEFEKYRIPYRLIMFEGADHGINEYKQEVRDHVLQWFEKYLKHNSPLPVMEYHGR